MSVPEPLNTDRLAMERIRFDHEPLLYGIHTDERVTATLGGPKSEDQNRDWVVEKVQHWEDNGFGLYAFFDREGNFVGRGGLLQSDVDGKREIEINYSIVSECWGRAYATEAATRFVQLCFDHLPVDSIIAFTKSTNTGSRRVMEKIGLTFSHDFDHHGTLHALYRIQRPSPD